MADLSVAVVGAGVHGSRYAEHLLRLEVPGARLAGVCRRTATDAERWRSRGVRFETDFSVLVDDPSVDAFVVASPPDCHEEHALAILSRGKPLLLEKPVAPDMAACGRIREAAERAGVPVRVGHTHRYNPVAAAFREEARRMLPLRHLSLSQRHERMPMAWQHREPGGGALLCLGVHMADLARWITGEEIAAVLSCVERREPGEAEGSAAVAARLTSGTSLAVEVSIAAPVRRGSLEAFGAGGFSLEGDLVLHELRRRRGRGVEPVPLPPPLPGIVPLLRDFVSAARGGAWGDAATLADGIAAVAFVERCRQVAVR